MSIANDDLIATHKVTTDSIQNVHANTYINSEMIHEKDTKAIEPSKNMTLKSTRSLSCLSSNKYKRLKYAMHRIYKELYCAQTYNWYFSTYLNSLGENGNPEDGARIRVHEVEKSGILLLLGNRFSLRFRNPRILWKKIPHNAPRPRR